MAKRLGLIIGNSVYNESSLTRLLTPDVDVGSLAEVLLNPEIGGFDDVNVLVNTSSATVRRAISSFFSGKNKDDLLILYFSGHGVLDQQGRLFLAVKDTDRKLLRGTAIPANYITDEMNNSRSRRQVLILDCCHSGAFARGTKGAAGVSVGTAAAFEGTGFGRVVLTASDATQYAWEGDQVIGKGENSLFTHYLTEGLKSGEADANGDGKITVDEIYDFVYEQVVKHTPKQTPGKWSYKEQGDIVIAQAPNLETTPQELSELPEGKKEQEERFEEYYTKGLSAVWLEEWEEAARYFEAIVDVRPDYEQAAAKLQEARKQIRQNNLYNKALAAMEAAEWEQGISNLEVLVAEQPDFKDAIEKLQFMRKQKILAELHAEAKHLSQAGQWQAVVKIFGRITEIDPDYPDPEGLFAEAEHEITELQHQIELKEMLGRAVREMDSGHWEDARRLLIQILELEPGYQKTEELLVRVEAEITRQETENEKRELIDQKYKQAINLEKEHQWHKALVKMKEIMALDPQFPDPNGIYALATAEIERQNRLSDLYTQAETAQKSKDWDGVQTVLEELVAIEPDYLDATEKLEFAKQQKNLILLYAKASQAYTEGQWQEVIDIFNEITDINPKYPDPEDLLASSELALADAQRQAKLEDMYGSAIHEIETGSWNNAFQLLTQIQNIEPTYCDTEQLLEKVTTEIARKEEERQLQEQVATLYEQAQGLVRARQWRQALAKMDEIQSLDPHFVDNQGVTKRANKALQLEAAEAQKQTELAELYAKAVALMRSGQYQEALEKWNELQKRDPHYPDQQKVQKTSKKNLAALTRPTRTYVWQSIGLPWKVAAGVLLGLVLIAGAYWGWNEFNSKRPSAIGTAQPIVFVADETETPIIPTAIQTEQVIHAVVETEYIPSETPTPSEEVLPLRIKVITNSDWVDVNLCRIGSITESSSVDTGGITEVAEIRDCNFVINQEIERAEQGYTIYHVEDIKIIVPSGDQMLGFSLDKGCIGMLVVEIYNMVSDPPILVKRFVNYECCPCARYFNLKSDLLRTDNPPPSPTPLSGLVPSEVGTGTSERTAGCVPPPNGLVSWWPGDGNAYDIAGDNHGIPRNGVAYSDGKVGTAFVFPSPRLDDEDGYVDILNSTSLDPLQELSIEAWVRLDSGPSDRIERFVTITAPGEVPKAVLRYDGLQTPGNLHFYMGIDGEFRHVWVPDVLQAGVFHHVAGTYDGSVMRVYLDGEEVGRLTVAGDVASGHSNVSLSSPGEPLFGILDEIGIYDRALSAEEIQAIYMANGAGKCKP